MFSVKASTLYKLPDMMLWILLSLMIVNRAVADNTPYVMVVILVRNEAHLLPTFFGYLEELDYPKKSITLWIRSDHNNDSTPEMLDEWLDNHAVEYKFVDVKIQAEPKVRLLIRKFQDFVHNLKPASPV